MDSLFRSTPLASIPLKITILRTVLPLGLFRPPGLELSRTAGPDGDWRAVPDRDQYAPCLPCQGSRGTL